MYQWIVIGAGPAGISSIGSLLDLEVPPQKICWVDPNFYVGKIPIYDSVPSNTTIEIFRKFLTHIKSFDIVPDQCKLWEYDPKDTVDLGIMLNILNTVTDTLRHEVNSLKGIVTEIHHHHHHHNGEHHSGYDLQIKTSGGHMNLASKNIIFAIGASPKKLDHPGLPRIELEDCYDKWKLKNRMLRLDRDIKYIRKIMVVGGSHSAMLVIKTLYELLEISIIKYQIINVYREDIKFAEETSEGWIKYDNTGLKGEVAIWVEENIDKITRYHCDDPQLKKVEAECDVVIDAMGYERNFLPKIKTHGHFLKDNHIKHDPETGELKYHDKKLHGLYGIGIAFPESRMEPYGQKESRVGMYKFADYSLKFLKQAIVHRSEHKKHDISYNIKRSA